MIAKNLFDATKQEYRLWEEDESSPLIHYYPAKENKSDAAIVIFPGGAYRMRATHEGAGYAEYFNELGIDAFVVDYRVYPNLFPLPLLDARRAVRFVRYYSEKLGLCPDKIAIIGSSAGGHLCAMAATYRDAIDGEGVDEIDEMPYLADSQILCYPVISTTNEEIWHGYSVESLLGADNMDFAPNVSPELIADEKTPDAFIWHTANDNAVNVINSYVYATALRRNNVPTELHVFPDGAHGLGLAKDKPDSVGQWAGLLANWLKAKTWI